MINFVYHSQHDRLQERVETPFEIALLKETGLDFNGEDFIDVEGA